VAGWHSNCSSSCRASCSFMWSDVRPQTTQNHSWVAGFHLISRYFMASVLNGVAREKCRLKYETRQALWEVLNRRRAKTSAQPDKTAQ
jgi:hypothetical protein